ncbi:MAG: bifunctional ornithine acetyltransferase/N-acetylglutamate synthase [Lachnospiraceae bacterium]|nr:bifunctional ornithine acetyltransferase/N-acetylglutamate synthase [Lachnospiraceae bacterium]
MIKIEGGVTAPKGFKAAGLRAGVKPTATKKDMALIVSECDAVCAGTFTLNKVKAAPVKWDQAIVDTRETVRAMVANSGVANACTGVKGMENCRIMAEAVAKHYDGMVAEDVLVLSTGVIGAQLPMDVICKGADMLVDALDDSVQAADDAANAILTTDTRKKEIAVQIEIDGTTVTIGGMCKGAGMIHPNMGTMLGFITTDVAINKELLVKALKGNIDDTFNMVSVDGDTSTNDTVVIMANGMAGNKLIDKEDESFEKFNQALYVINEYLAKSIAGDGEGATKLFEVQAYGAATKEDAKLLSKAVVCSSLTKAAVFGRDANWGRILCAMGYSGAEFDPEVVDITLKSEAGELAIVKDGVATDYSEEFATEILSQNPVIAIVDAKAGASSATAWGCDLT